MNSLRSRIIVAIVVVLAFGGFLTWASLRGDDLPVFQDPVPPAGTLTRSDEELPFDDPIEEPTLDEDPADPPPDDGALVTDDEQRWPLVSDAAIADAEQSYELQVPGGGRLLVLVDCDSDAFGMSIVMSGVGLPPEIDVVGLLSPAVEQPPGFVTDPGGNGFGASIVDLPEEIYRLTFDMLSNLSLSIEGCPSYFTEASE